MDVQGSNAVKAGRLQSQSSLSTALALAAQLVGSPARPAAAKQSSPPAWKRTDVRLSAATMQWARPDAALDGVAGGAVLQQIDFVVPRGALAVVLGNSGSGKTTLLRGIMQVISGASLHRNWQQAAVGSG